MKDNRSQLFGKSLHQASLTVRFILAASLAVAGSFVTPHAQAQNPPFLWVAHTVSDDYDFPSAIAVDRAGDIFVTGAVFSTNSTLQGQVLTDGAPSITLSGGATEEISAYFTAKFDPSGNLLWARQAGPHDGSAGLGCAVDSQSNVIVTGRMLLGTNFTLGNVVLTNAGSENIFVVKYDPQGNLVWVREAGGTGIDLGNSVSVDSADNIFVGGNLGSSNAVFGSFHITNSNPDPQDLDAFLAKYDSSGNVLWVRQVKRQSTYANAQVATDLSGACYLSANFTGVADFGTFALTNSGGSEQDVTFTAKYDSAGNPLWAQATGGGDFGIAAGIATDPQGNACVVGTVFSMIKYDPSGNTLWTKGIPGTANAVSADAAGNFYVAGQFGTGVADFGGITLTNPVGNAAGFIAKYDSSANILWAKGVTGPASYSYNLANAVASDRWGNVCVAGQLGVPSASFDAITVTTTAVSDIFVTKIGGPQLSIAPTGSQAVVSWPTNATGLMLESSISPSGQTWSPVTNSSVVSGTQNTVTITASDSSHFFRLQSQ